MSHCSNARKIPLFTGLPLTCRCKLLQKSWNLQEISGKSFNFLSNIYLFSEILCYLFIKKGISEQAKTLNLSRIFRDK